MAVPRSEETLLYGVLAMELEMADRESVVRTLDAWAGDPSRSIADYLEALGIREPDDRARIEEAVIAELQQHGNDPVRVLATLPMFADIRDRLPGPHRPVATGDSMATVVGDQPAYAAPPAEESVPPTEVDPYATRVGPALLPPGFGVHGGSEINPIRSEGPTRDHRGPSNSGSMPTPDLRPLSSMEIPYDRPSPGSGSELPRFDPSATPGFGVESPPGFDPEATSNADQMAGTEDEQHANQRSEVGQDHDPLATSAIGIHATSPGFGPSSISAASGGAFGFIGSSSSRFKVVREHAKGGLGAVMVAYDEELRREVALKEIQERHADNPDSRARFLLEAEITGGLEHPGVVPVYSLGRNPDGRPYYAMRFIRGDSLRKAIEQFHDPKLGPKDPGDRAIQLRALLRRFIDVCNALEYAHSRGVIHRDIKPDNIMLGPYGETLLVDWGLAKALDHVEVPSRTREMPLRPASVAGSTPTLDGSAIGTPAYMSPEQAEGDLSRIGIASDVYSLGATLYHILTGSPPFTERNLFQVLIKVREGDFPSPRQLKPDVSPALEAVCLTAMARSTEDRYDSCRVLADDLEKWLADEPVSVYLDPWAVRLGRWAKRHRTLVTGVGVLLITAVVGLSVGSLLLKQERDRTELARQDAIAGWDEARQNEATANAQREQAELNAEEARKNALEAQENARIALENEKLAEANEQRARDNEALAVAQRRIAEANFQSAVDAVDALLTEVGEIDLADVPQMEQTRRDLLLKARTFYEQFLAENDSPETRRDAGRAHSRLGDIDELLGEYAEARDSYDQALAIQEPLAEAAPEDPVLAADLARTRHNKAILLKELNEFEASEALLNQARSTRESLLENDPDSLDARSDLASSIYQLGAVLARLVGRRQEAHDLYDRAIGLQRIVVEGRDGRDEDLRELARYLNNLALLLQGTSPDEANDAFEEAATYQRRLSEANSDVPHYRRELARTLNNHVRDAIVANPDEAEPSLREAIDLVEGLTEKFPSVPDYWSELGGYLSNLGRALSERGRAQDDQDAAKEAEDLFRRAEEAYRRSEAIRSDLVERYPIRPEYRHRLALLRQALSAFIRLRNKGEEAAPMLDSAIELLRGLVESNPDVPEYQKDLALALQELAFSTPETPGAAEEVRSRLEEALSFAESAARDRPNDATYWGPLMGMHSVLGAIEKTLGHPEEMMEHARFLAENSRGDARWLYNASVLTLDAATIGRDKGATEEQFEADLAEAFALLRAASDAGYRQLQTAEAEFKEFADRPDVAESLERMRNRKGADR